jgi:hypothetical protein
VSTALHIPESIRPLISRWGKNPVEVRDVTVRSGVADKRAYRCVFEDGSQAKARLLLGADHAGRWGALREKIGERSFLSSMFLKIESAVLEEWVPGEVLPQTKPPANLLCEAGAVLARIHKTAVPEYGAGDADPEVAKCFEWLSELARVSAIDAESERLLALRIRREAPTRMSIGVAHQDFCGENLVLHPQRGVVSIDHEWMRIGCLDFDVARAVRQWNLTAEESGIFSDGYAAAGGPVDMSGLDFWLLANDLFASEVRVRRGWTDAPATLRRLMNWIQKQRQTG